MKLIIDISDEEYKTLSKMSEKEKVNELSYYEKAIANGTPYEKTQSDIISREALKKAFKNKGEGVFKLSRVIGIIDNAPTVEDRYSAGYSEGFFDGHSEGYSEGYRDGIADMRGEDK